MPPQDVPSSLALLPLPPQFICCLLYVLFVRPRSTHYLAVWVATYGFPSAPTRGYRERPTHGFALICTSGFLGKPTRGY